MTTDLPPAPSPFAPSPLPSMRASRVAFRLARTVSAFALAFLTLPLTGCGVAAFPCRIVSATLKIVPDVGNVAAAPFDTCAAVID